MDKQEIKAVFFDIDGTLVCYRDHNYHLRDLDSLRQLRNKGIKMFIASGRDLGIPREVKILDPVIALMDGFISANGQHCYLADGTEISSHPLPDEVFLPIRRRCEEHHIALLYYIGHDSFVTELTEHVRYFAGYVGVPHPPVRPIPADFHDPQKICIYVSPEEEERFLKPLLKNIGTARNTAHLIDLIPEGIGKDSGIREISSYFGFTPDETMAFGDGENDIPMLKAAGIGVAMGSAEDHVKAASDYITTPSEEAGITQALLHFGLI